MPLMMQRDWYREAQHKPQLGRIPAFAGMTKFTADCEHFSGLQSQTAIVPRDCRGWVNTFNRLNPCLCGKIGHGVLRTPSRSCPVAPTALCQASRERGRRKAAG